jgi:hypothetical protein
LFPLRCDACNSYRVAASRESISPQENRRRFAQQHRNNVIGKVFAAMAVAAVAETSGNIAAVRGVQRKERPGNIPAPSHLAQFKRYF